MGTIRSAIRRFSNQSRGYKIITLFIGLTLLLVFFRIVLYPFREYLDDALYFILRILGKIFGFGGKAIKEYALWVKSVFADSFFDGLLVLMATISILIVGWWAARRFWQRL